MNDIKWGHNTQQNDTQHDGKIGTLSITFILNRMYPFYHYTVYAQFILKVIMLSVSISTDWCDAGCSYSERHYAKLSIV